jgi:hypothetical protein
VANSWFGGMFKENVAAMKVQHNLEY